MSLQKDPVVLVVADLDNVYMAAFEAALGDFPGVRPLRIGVQQLERGGVVDAVFLTLPQAEKWNSKPILHRAQVLPTNPQDPDDDGLPPYVIAGVAKTQSDPSDSPEFDLELTVRCILVAANEHNDSCVVPEELIEKVGLWPPMIGMDQLAPEVAARIMVSTYEGVVRRDNNTTVE